MDRIIKVIILDDDSSARNILSKFLEVGDKVQIVASESNAESAMSAIERLVPDAIFLDINMPKEDGIQFAKRLRQKNIDIQIIFTTAYRNYAASAFELKPLDFMVKPFGINEVFDVLTSLNTYFDEKNAQKGEHQIWGAAIPEKLKFKTKKGFSFIKPNDILYIKVHGLETNVVFLNGKKLRVFSTLIDLNTELKHINFLRINRSVIVNLAYLENINKQNRICSLKGKDFEDEFPVTKSIFKYFENMKSIKLG